MTNRSTSSPAGCAIPAPAGRPAPATDEEWARTKARFPGNYLALREEAERMVADGTLYED